MPNTYWDESAQIYTVSCEDYEQLQQERDALAAYVEELECLISVIAEVFEADKEYDLLLSDINLLLNKSPQTCLAEHDARVVEDMLEECGVCSVGRRGFVGFNAIKEYADQLRNKANGNS